MHEIIVKIDTQTINNSSLIIIMSMESDFNHTEALYYMYMWWSDGFDRQWPDNSVDRASD